MSLHGLGPLIWNWRWLHTALGHAMIHDPRGGQACSCGKKWALMATLWLILAIVAALVAVVGWWIVIRRVLKDRKKKRL